MLKLSHESLFRTYVGFALFTFLIPWPLTVGSQTVMSPDIAMSLFLCIIFGSFLLHPSFRFRRGILALMMLILTWQIWMTAALLINPDRSGFILLFRIFKRVWLLLPCVLMGYWLARSSPTTKLYFLSALLIWTTVSASIGIIQTASQGRLLTGVLTNRRFLGFLTLLPDKRYEYQDLEYQRRQAESGRADSAFYIGTIFRAHGPFEEPNGLTAAIAPMTSFALGLLFYKGTLPINRRRSLSFFLIFLLAQVVSFGAAGIFALGFVGIRIFWYLSINQRRTTIRWLSRPKNVVLIGLGTLLVLGLLAGITAFVLTDPSSVLAQRIARITNPTTNEGWTGRVNVWSISMNYIATSPWFGIGRFPTQLEYGISWLDTTQAPMNTYITVGLLTGLPSQFMFIAIILVFVHISWRIYRKGETNLDCALGLACHLYFIALIVIGLVYDWIFFEGVAYLFFLLGGWCIATLNATNQSKLQKNMAAQPLAAFVTDGAV